MTLYRERRAALLRQNPGVEWLLPEEAPSAPALVPLAVADLVRLARPAATTQADLILVNGWGDGQLIKVLSDDPICRQKHMHILIYRGEEGAVAHALSLETVDLTRFSHPPNISFIPDRAAIHRMICSVYLGMPDIPVLAGMDFIDGHPLLPEAAAVRDELRPELITQLSDRPKVYGNDIADSFTGLYQSSLNAAKLLPAPTIGEMSGFFGDTPVISIAAGPSLKRHLDELRALQDRCILVACDAVLHGLRKEGIDPHFVTPLERTDSTTDMLLGAETSRAIYAGLPVCPTAAVSLFPDDRVIGLYCGDRLYDWLVPQPGQKVNTGHSTGTLSLSVAVALGTGPVYLVGHDLSRDASGSHWAGAAYAGKAWKDAKDDAAGRASQLSGMEDRMVLGNDGTMVPSIAWWDRFRHDLEYEALRASSLGRKLYNVNAHDGIFAKIEHTLPAPLPRPEDLPVLPPIRLPARKPERFQAWRERAKLLDQDAEAFRTHIQALRADIATTGKLPPGQWDVEGLAKRLTLTAAVSEGNREAFAYILRSALYNSTAEMHLRRRTPSWARSRWRMMEAMDCLCHGIDNALRTLSPKIQEVARDHG